MSPPAPFRTTAGRAYIAYCGLTPVGVRVPVTARLSKLFYDRFGDEIVGELVDWFNQVDATYRSDLRELNEHNFARFDAKLEQRIAELDAKLSQRMAELEAKLSQRITELDAKMERRLAELETKLSQRIAELEAKFERRFAELDAKIDRVSAETREFLERRLGEQTRWLFIAWATIMVAVIGFGLRR